MADRTVYTPESTKAASPPANEPDAAEVKTVNPFHKQDIFEHTQADEKPTETLIVLSAVRNDHAFGAQTATVIIQGSTPDEAGGLAAKNLAYKQRFELKMDRSGIEAMGGTTPVRSNPDADPGEEPKYVYQREFRLTEML